jgi:hypothetical protein
MPAGLQRSPHAIVIASFAILIAMGTAILSLPVATHDRGIIGSDQGMANMERENRNTRA